MKKRLLFVIALLAVLALIPALSQKLQVTSWTMSSEKLDQGVRFALLTDLHNSFYGENQEQLVAAIDAAKVDAVLMSGDMADNAQTLSGVCTLVENLGGRYPVFYVSGNHECDSDADLALIKRSLRDLNVTVLEGESLLLRDDVRIAGADDPKCLYREEWKAQIADCRTTDDVFTILLSHRPDRIDAYRDFDLTLCGHAHGGQLRVFGQGIWAPNQGFLPEYTSGFYPAGDGKMFVSRGLAKGWLPRFCNRPELAIIEINPAP